MEKLKCVHLIVGSNLIINNNIISNDGNNYINDVNGDGALLKCVRTCPTGKYKLDSNHTCATCSVAMTGC